MNRRELEKVETLAELAKSIVKCRRCPRLVRYRATVPPRKSFMLEEYWRRPVPGFGDPEASLVLVGLAPAAHGGNRTGRVFTGDESGRFLVRALYEAGYASQPRSEAIDDGLVFTDCYVTAAVKCAPPHDKPTAKEFNNCNDWLASELRLLTKAMAVVTLGRAAFDAYVRYASRRGSIMKEVRFSHGKKYAMGSLPTLYASYHPSPRNTHTGKLTMGMLVSLLERVKEETYRKLVSERRTGTELFGITLPWAGNLGIRPQKLSGQDSSPRD